MKPSIARFLRNGFAFWSVLALITIANGALAAPLLASLFDEAAARPLASLVYLALAYPLIALFLGHSERPAGVAATWALGALWALLTLALEAILFVGVLGASADRVSEAFTLSGLAAGNLFAVELGLLLAAPALFARAGRTEPPARRPDRPARRAPLQRSRLPAE